MKQKVLFILSLAMLFALCVPVFAGGNTAVETFVIDDFDSPDERDWTWEVNASRFIADGFPKKAYVAGIPNSLRPFHDPDGPEAKVLGVQVSYNRKGDNWFEFYPTATNDDGEKTTYEVPLKGNVSHFDFWVWGAGYRYYLEIMVRDSDGRVRVLPACATDYRGWQNIIVSIPSSINQKSRLRSGPKTLTFVGFRVRSDPAEFVDDYVIYIDALRYTTYMLSNIYDGYDLQSVDFDAVEGE